MPALQNHSSTEWEVPEKRHGREGEGTEEGAGCCFSRSFCKHLVVPTLGQALF